MARKPAPPGVDRRQQILEAALDVFAEQGFEGATTKDIAARADVTHGLIYFYFTSKEELFQAAFEYAFQRGLERLDIHDLLTSGDAPAQVIERGLTRLLDLLGAARMMNLARIMMSMATHGERKVGPLKECKTHMASAVGEVLREVRVYLDEQIERGLLRPVDTRTVINLLVGGVIATLRTNTRNGAPPIRAPEQARAICDIVMGGLLPRSEVAAEAGSAASAGEVAEVAPIAAAPPASVS